MMMSKQHSRQLSIQLNTMSEVKKASLQNVPLNRLAADVWRSEPFSRVHFAFWRLEVDFLTLVLPEWSSPVRSSYCLGWQLSFWNQEKEKFTWSVSMNNSSEIAWPDLFPFKALAGTWIWEARVCGWLYLLYQSRRLIIPTPESDSTRFPRTRSSVSLLRSDSGSLGNSRVYVGLTQAGQRHVLKSILGWRALQCFLEELPRVLWSKLWCQNHNIVNFLPMNDIVSA